MTLVRAVHQPTLPPDHGLVCNRLSELRFNRDVLTHMSGHFRLQILRPQERETRYFRTYRLTQILISCLTHWDARCTVLTLTHHLHNQAVFFFLFRLFGNPKVCVPDHRFIIVLLVFFELVLPIFISRVVSDVFEISSARFANIWLRHL